MIIKKSQFNIGETLDRLQSSLKAKGIKPIARVNHSAAAKSVDMELRPTEVLFLGNPKLVLFQDDIVTFSAPLMIRGKAQCATNGLSIGKRCNAVAEHQGSALRVSLSAPMDCVVPFAKGEPFPARHALP